MVATVSSIVVVFIGCVVCYVFGQLSTVQILPSAFVAVGLVASDQIRQCNEAWMFVRWLNAQQRTEMHQKLYICGLIIMLL
jgi:hypothetical protein